MQNKTGNNFVSGGRNPNWESTCSTCRYLDKATNQDGGWCKHNLNTVVYPGRITGSMPSVASTGGCDLHKTKECPLCQVRTK